MKKIEYNSDNFFLKIWNCSLCRISLLFFTAVLFFLFLISVLANPVLNLIVKSQIINSINNSKTNLRIDALDFSLFTNKIAAYNSVLIIKDSTDFNKNFTRISIPYFAVKKINWFVFLFESGYKFNDIIIDKPEILINNFEFADSSPKNISRKDTSGFSDSTLSQKLAKLIPDELNPLKIGSLTIHSAKIIRTFQSAEKKEDKTIDSIKNLTITITDIYIDKNADYKSEKKSLIGNYELRIKEFHSKMFGQGYDLKIASITASGSTSELKINKFTFRPYISDEEFFKGDRYRRDRWIAIIPEITTHQTDLKKFLNENILAADSLIIPNFKIEIFTNRRLPIDPATKPEMPHEIMSSLGFGIEIKKFKIKTSSVILESVMPGVKRRAHLEFTNINAQLDNISNTKSKRTKENPCIITVSGYLQSKGKFDIKLKYPLLSNHFNFNYKGSLKEMDARLFNSHLEVEDKSHIVSGKIVQVVFSSEVRNGISSVNIIPVYNNIELKMLDEQSKNKNKLETFLVNLIALRKSNPDDEGKIKSGNITYIRGPQDTFLDVIWLALLKGLGEVVGF